MSAAPPTRHPAVRPPSIRARLAGALAIWAVVWSIAVGGAIVIVATHEVGELLDDTLQSSAEWIALLVTRPSGDLQPATAVVNGGKATDRFAWQVTAEDGTLLMRSARAPSTSWKQSHAAGFSDADGWRIYGLTLGDHGRMLYVAQSHAERHEAQREVAVVATLAALIIGLVAYLWLRRRVRTELQPLQTLSQHLADWDVDRAVAGATLGLPQRAELAPVQHAIEGLTQRLTARIANEQAFAANAAHALRTPLAGIDAQLAVALRECPPSLQGRLQRVRGAAARLQGVVTALLGLFRSGAQPQRAQLDVAALVARLPTALLDVRVATETCVNADPDLLAAALLNLLDNAQRHGAQRAFVERTPTGLRMVDDGPGVSPDQRQRLQSSLASQDYAAVGLGLMLADRVARAHGGQLRLIEQDTGFAVELDLGPAAASETPAEARSSLKEPS